MSDSDLSAADPLGQIADEFVEAFRQGKRPSVEEFARRYPAHADELRDMLPALAIMEWAKSEDDSSEPRPSIRGSAAPLQQLGDYQILREVGRGGMGVVYEAQQLSLGRHVAIKLLPAHALLDARHLNRFQREARAAARLHHTNIVPVFGVGEQDGLHYYVMQFIPGLGLDVVLDELRRLRQPRGKTDPTQGDTPGQPTKVTRDVSAVDVAHGLLTGEFRQPASARTVTTVSGKSAEEKDGGSQKDTSDSSLIDHRSSISSATIRLPGQIETSTLSESGRPYWQSVARIGMQVADALAHAASQGVLHRDIKPSNLLLDDTGNVWVTDFGLAKGETDGDNLTHTGDIVGTLRYMAPERFNGKADVRSDVYALGLTLYELLTLRPAFDEVDRNKLVKQVMHDEPVRPRKLNPGVPRDLETVVLKAIARDPAHRYQTPAAMVEDLKRFVEDRPVRARRINGAERLWRSCRRNPVMAGMAVALVLALAVGATVSYLKYLDAEQQKGVALEKEKVALQEAERATKARDFLVSIFRKAETSEKGGNVTIRQLLDGAETEIPDQFVGQPELSAELVKVIREVKRGIARRIPQAMILEVRGTVQVQSAAGDKRKAVPQALVHLDDQLSLSADAEVLLVFLSDLYKERVGGGREVTIDTKGCEPADAVRERDTSVQMTFVRLPKGTFYMGWGGWQRPEGVSEFAASVVLQGQPFATAALVSYQRTAPARGWKKEIEEDFEIAVHDVTQGQWEAVMGNNPSWFSRKGKSRSSVQDISDEELKLFPVEMVSWDDAQEFIKKLNEKERGRGYVYRLPSEAEWEYACRGGANSLAECSYNFYFDKPTNDLSSEQANFDGNYPFGKGSKGPYLLRPTRVGAYPPNKLGLCDMHGNVRQWTSSREGSVRVYRGGDWHMSGSNCRAGLRLGDEPTTRYSHIGFRLARVPVRDKVK
jgi:serine/threonine protein kinase/formylglycine-generating enzyme required for sulfatase activity